MEKFTEGMALSDFLSTIVNTMINFVIHLAVAVVVFYAGKWIINRLYKWIHNLLNKKNADQSLSTFLLSLVRITLYFLLIVVVIGILGIETSSFIALFASAGVAIGMALSGTLQNFAGGVLILLLKPYKVGDMIEAQGFTGTVKEIQIFSTILITGDNKAIIIPNGPLSTGSINNYTRESRRRVEWTVSVAYGTDADKAIELIKKLVSEHPAVITDGSAPAPMAEVTALAASSVDIVVRAWTASSDFWTVYFGMNRTFYSELPANGIEFPFPQLDVHIAK
ncbi:MAG: mechanosensitive ion channel [Muribaculaceae bacterium]|nr:mechanosensitive ion channel [Muribaculaceae bacterium]